MAHFVFINPSTQDSKGSTSLTLTMPPIGLAYLAAVVELKGHSVEIIDAHSRGILPGKIKDHIKSEPDVIGITANILTIRRAASYARELKTTYPHAQMVFGGPQVSVMKRAVLEKYAFIDALVLGEGESTISALADRIGKKDIYAGIRGVIYRDKGRIVENDPRPLIQNINTIPIPAYHLLPPLSNYRTRSRAYPVGYIFTSRGCPASCTFCYRNFGRQWRARTPENVLEEVTLLREKYGIRQLDILDDNFCFDADRAYRILEMIISKNWKLKINLQIGVRVNSLDKKLLTMMKRAGVFKFGFGIESGDKELLKRVKKGLDLDYAVKVVGLARSLGIITQAYFIIGFPGDSCETMQSTIDFAKKLNPHYASFSICTPLPGTEMYNDIAANGVFLEDVSEGIDEGLFALKAFFKYGDMTPEQVTAYCERAWKQFYFRPGKIIDVLTTIRSLGEFNWLIRVIADAARTKDRKKNRFLLIGDGLSAYFIVVTLFYLLWRARIFLERFVSH
ncbi:MAG: radical SAM protein [Candidatus Omnitrophica bacterium]|nr:radical SAM protein [Candidatus Omnitrophota bacterium]